MRISTLGYVGKQGIKNIGRNKMFSVASIATMSACIFLFGLFFAILLNFQYIIKTAEEGVAITVFFDEDVTEEQIKNIGDVSTMIPLITLFFRPFIPNLPIIY